MNIEVSDEELALITEALDDSAGVFDQGATDADLEPVERQDFINDAERCRALAERLRVHLNEGDLIP